MSLPTIAAVKYACDGEAARGLYKTYNLPLRHDIFEHGEVSELSCLIGMPLVIQQVYPSLLQVFRSTRTGPGGKGKGKGNRERDDEVKPAYSNYNSKDGADYFPNITAAHMMLVCSSTTTTPIFCPPAKWVDKVGNVLIARQDMVPLHPMHIEILKGFITAAHDELVEESQGMGLTADAVAKKITPGSWRAYWAMATDHMHNTGQGGKLVDVPTPFDEGDFMSTKAAPQDEDGGGVRLGGDPDMMDCSDVGFAQ